MQYNIGDKISFLNETGGGIVVKQIDKETIEIEIEDGFVIPALIKDIILVEKYNVLTPQNNIKKEEQIVNQKVKDTKEYNDIYKESLKEEVDLTEGVYLAFTPIEENSKELNVYLINNTNYDAIFTYSLKIKNEYIGVDKADLESRSMLLLETISEDIYHEWSSPVFQIIFFKQDNYNLLTPIFRILNISEEKLKNIDSFSKSVFFETPALYMKIAKLFQYKEKVAKEDTSKIKEVKHKYINDDELPILKRINIQQQELLNIKEKVVDLHIGTLFENISGMSNSEMLHHQLNHFKKELDTAIVESYSKVTFIHGIGNGVLKGEIIKYLKHQSGIVFFDGNDVGFGNGATVVKIL